MPQPPVPSCNWRITETRKGGEAVESPCSTLMRNGNSTRSWQDNPEQKMDGECPSAPSLYLLRVKLPKASPNSCRDQRRRKNGLSSILAPSSVQNSFKFRTLTWPLQNINFYSSSFTIFFLKLIEITTVLPLLVQACRSKTFVKYVGNNAICNTVHLK